LMHVWRLVGGVVVLLAVFIMRFGDIELCFAAVSRA
jgi:hypothetical protein